MVEYLFIGGSWDGERVRFARQPDKRVSRIKKADACFQPPRAQDHIVPTILGMTEDYIRHIFYADCSEIWVYAVNGMTDIEIQRKLIEGYRR